MSLQEIKSQIEANLQPGDSPEAIERFLKNQGWPYSYDQYARRYQSGYPEGRENTFFTKKVVAIWIYVDNDGNFDYADVENIYTGM